MDFMTFIGLFGGLGLYSYGIIEGDSVKAFLNAHGILLVCGGTIAVTLIYCPAHMFVGVLQASMKLFFPTKLMKTEKLIDKICELAKKARMQGFDALDKDISSIKDDGFFLRAYHTCLTSPDEMSARNAIEREVIQLASRHKEVIAVYKVLGMVAPMMGLMGTVIGIVSVLKNISDPSKVGSSMGVAMSTVFYGILLAGLFFNPMAGKLRVRSGMEMLTKEIILEGLLAIQFSRLTPTELERRLVVYLQSRSIAKVLKKSEGAAI